MKKYGVLDTLLFVGEALLTGFVLGMVNILIVFAIGGLHG